MGTVAKTKKRAITPADCETLMHEAVCAMRDALYAAFPLHERVIVERFGDTFAGFVDQYEPVAGALIVRPDRDPANTVRVHWKYARLEPPKESA